MTRDPAAGSAHGPAAGPASRPSPLAVATLLAALAVPAAIGALPLAHDDLFGHLSAGRWIVDHGRVPAADPFSFTRPGARWVSHEWGFSLAVYGVWGAGGPWALVGLSAALATALFAAIGGAALRRVPADRRAAAAPLVAALLLAAAWAVSLELFLRAALAGAVCFALLAIGLGRFRERPSAARGAAVAVLVLVWANLHSGVVLGLALVGLSAVDAASRQRRRVLPHLLLAAACAAAALANPHGIDALLYPFRLARLLADPASGFEAGHFAGGWPGRQAVLGALLAATLAGLFALARRGRRPSPGSPPARHGPLAGWELAALALFGAGSFATARLSVEFAVLLVPAAAAVGAALLGERAAPARRRGGRALAAAVLTAALVVASGTLAARPPGPVSPHFPAGAADFLRAHGLLGRAFHHQNWGGYLGWRLGTPVFWDGRNDVFAPLVRELATIPFARVAERYGVEVLILSPREIAQLAPELARGRWGLVYADGRAAVFLSRRAYPEVLERLEIRPPPPV